jgi:hypothetical protein
MVKPFHFEGKVDSVSRSKRGTFIRLEISEAPAELLGLQPGQRLMIGASPIGDFDEDVGDGERAVQTAGILCRSSAFWKYIETRSRYGETISSEEEAAKWLREKLGIDSRSDLKHDEAARTQLRKYNESFQRWVEQKSL